MPGMLCNAAAASLPTNVTIALCPCVFGILFDFPHMNCMQIRIDFTQVLGQLFMVSVKLPLPSHGFPHSLFAVDMQWQTYHGNHGNLKLAHCTCHMSICKGMFRLFPCQCHVRNQSTPTHTSALHTKFVFDNSKPQDLFVPRSPKLCHAQSR